MLEVGGSMLAHIRIVLAFLIAFATVVRAAPGDVVDGPFFLKWRPGHIIEAGGLHSLVSSDRGFFGLDVQGVLMKLTASGALDTAFGSGGVTWIPGSSHSALATGPDGQLYVATVKDEWPLGEGTWLKIGRVESSGELIYDWGPDNQLVSIGIDAGYFESHHVVVDDTGVYVFASFRGLDPDQAEFLYAVWNLDGTPRALGSGENFRLIPLFSGDWPYPGARQVFRTGARWVLYQQRSMATSGALAFRLDVSGELDATFGSDGVIPVSVGSLDELGVWLDGYFYVAELRKADAGDGGTWLRRYDSDGQLDTAYGEKLVDGLPGSVAARSATIMRIFPRSGLLDFWLDENVSEEHDLSRWLVNPATGAATFSDRYPFSACQSCSADQDIPVLFDNTGASEPGSVKFIHYMGGNTPRVVSVAPHDKPDIGEPVSALGSRLGDKMLWMQQRVSGNAILSVTDLSGNIQHEFGVGGATSVDQARPWFMSSVRNAFLDGPALRLVTSTYFAICGGSLGLPELPLSVSLVEVTDSGKILEDERVDLRDRIEGAGADTNKCSSRIDALRFSGGALDLANEGDVFRLSGEDYQDVVKLRDDVSGNEYLPVTRESAVAGVLQLTRASSETLGVRGIDALLMLDTDYLPKAAFNGGSSLNFPGLFPGTGCSADISSGLMDEAGRIYLTGRVVCAEFDRAYVLRFTDQGEPDAGFGTGGIVTVSDGWNASGRDNLKLEALLQQDGKLIVAESGRPDGASFSLLRVYRLLEDGSPDMPWGESGVVTVSDTSPGRDHAMSRMVHRESGNIRLFFRRDSGISTLEIEGDSAGPEEVSIFEIPAKPAQGSSSGGAVGLSLLMMLGGLGINRRRRGLRPTFSRGPPEIPHPAGTYPAARLTGSSHLLLHCLF